MLNEELPEWLDETEFGMVGIFTTAEGEKFAAEIVQFDDELNEIVVDVIQPSQSQASVLLGHQSIPVDRIVSFDPQARTTQPWPYSDPCRSAPFSLARFGLMTVLSLGMTAGGFSLFLLWANMPYGIQRASAVTYTLAEVFLTFAATGRLRRYLFTCPAVRPQIPNLILRHFAFVLTLLVLQTALLAARSSLPGWWVARDSKGGTPFEVALLLLCISIGYAQVFANRSLLERAHRDFSG
ncbi:hypothetical protein [Granulicella aggregans]|uniref:hypothetical protein n=1 Tax=Granulicella aggregans TaxID=474949 RepID=UPI0021DFA132|nr:hypothetical protein [Granulicella aggregans]